MKRFGFTLAELLVVVGIVGLLAAIVFPVFVRGKASAQGSVNISNLRQLSLGLILYAGDSDDWIPTWSEYAYDATNGLSAPSWGLDAPPVMWDSKLVPYVKQGNAPPVQEDLERPGVWHSPKSEDSERYRSYGINQMLVFEWLPAENGEFDVTRSRWRFLSLSQVDRHSETIGIGDGGREGRLSPPRNWDAWKDKYQDGLGYFRREAPWRYGGAAGYVMLDGHAKSIRGETLYKIPREGLISSSLLGQNHCDIARHFTPIEVERSWHMSIATEIYGINCI